MKIKFFCVKVMMIGSVATGRFFCGQKDCAPIPFELAGCGRFDRKSTIF
jgi:hypothetical protein